MAFHERLAAALVGIGYWLLQTDIADVHLRLLRF